jgi:hypothetical protein
MTGRKKMVLLSKIHEETRDAKSWMAYSLYATLKKEKPLAHSQFLLTSLE